MPILFQDVHSCYHCSHKMGNIIPMTWRKKWRVREAKCPKSLSWEKRGLEYALKYDASKALTVCWD